MPELPEVETTRRGIEPHLIGKQITKIIVRQPQLRWPIPDELQSLVGNSVKRVKRRAKYLLIETLAGSALVHLGMSGSLRLIASDEPAGYHDHVDLVLDDCTLRYTDPRRFGCWLFVAQGQQHALLSKLGPEPLSKDFDAQRLIDLSRGKKQKVKQFIMDNNVVVGVGNIYANEALFRAGISPVRSAGNISAKRYEKLYSDIVDVLSEAIEQGGTTLKDFVGGDGKPGYFQQTLHVYGRAGKPCTSCSTTLKEVRLNNRSTVYCPTCQR